MIRLDVHEAKAYLSRDLERLDAGEVIVLCRRNVAIAEIRLLPVRRSEPRPVRLARGSCDVQESFFEPLPEEVLEGFEGR